jgi:hypothetical protein
MGAVWNVNWFETGAYYLTPVDSEVDSDWSDWNIYFKVRTLYINEVIYVQAKWCSEFSRQRNREKNLTTVLYPRKCIWPAKRG